MKKFFFVLTFAYAASIIAQNAGSSGLKKFFENREGAIVIFNQTTGKYFRYNEKRCAERFSPKSTFKIPNSLIALETGVASDENFVIKWDGKKRWNENWNRDHTLASAIQFSVVPYYQELARRIGRYAYRKYLDEMGYGNKMLGDTIDAFWLDNSLKISADEQVEFLKKLYNYKLPFSKRTVDIVKKIMPSEKYEHSVLKFKTGTGEKENGTWIGWSVGYIEKGKDVYFFAFNIDAKTFDEVRGLRDVISPKILKSLKIVE